MADLNDGGAYAVMGIGNVYRVIKTTEAYYAQFLQDYQRGYSDGSEAVHTTIQSALDATVEGRNDYVVVQPSDTDYDLTAALTMSKKCVHLVCTGGFGYGMGATNACRLHQTTDGQAVIAVSDSAVEIAGFYMKNYQNHSAITIANGSYGLNIHNNTIVMNCTSTTSDPMVAGTGDGGGWGSIERNWIISQSGDDYTIASIITIGAGATGARVCDNEITIGDGATATVGISNAAIKGMTRGNTFGGAGADCTWTHCVAVNGDGNAIGNRGVVADHVLVTGGTNDKSFSDNMNGVNGGLVDDQD